MPLVTVRHSSPLPPERVRVVVRNALWQIGLETQTAIRQELEAAGRIDRGLLRASVTAKEPVVTLGRGVQETVVQGPPAAYAAPIDRGRRAGERMPPVAAIRAWVSRKRLTLKPRKGESREKALDRAAFLVARAIARRGIVGVRAFEKGAARVKPRLGVILAQHLAKERAQ